MKTQINALFGAMFLFVSGIASAQDKPNILVIWGDDIGQSNISAYTFGLMVTGHRISTESPVKA